SELDVHRRIRLGRQVDRRVLEAGRPDHHLVRLVGRQAEELRGRGTVRFSVELHRRAWRGARDVHVDGRRGRRRGRGGRGRGRCVGRGRRRRRLDRLADRAQRRGGGTRPRRRFLRRRLDHEQVDRDRRADEPQGDDQGDRQPRAFGRRGRKYRGLGRGGARERPVLLEEARLVVVRGLLRGHSHWREAGPGGRGGGGGPPGWGGGRAGGGGGSRRGWWGFLAPVLLDLPLVVVDPVRGSGPAVGDRGRRRHGLCAARGAGLFFLLLEQVLDR